jgi:uncharacterized protein involved in tolerance to divalent cations
MFFQLIMFFVTFSNTEQAKEIIAKLLDKRLIACANLISNVESFYRWKGNIQNDHEVLALLKTNPETPVIENWIAKLKEVAPVDENTVLVGHSVGCQAVLRYTETFPEGTKVRGIVLVAPWMELDETTIEEEGEEIKEIARPWMETPIDFEKIKTQRQSEHQIMLMGNGQQIHSDQIILRKE